MILASHIIIALSSVIYSTVLLISPSKTKLHITYALTALTIASGTLLVITMPSHMVSACESGLAYISIVLVAIVSAQRRMAKEKVRISDRGRQA